ncbi:MAG: OB-fold nucleic acid binding domain-containing protein, partial [Chloroflexota bacterium]
MNQGLELIDEPLMMKDLVRRTTKDDRAYILCTLSDKTGQISGVFWDIPERLNQMIRPGMVMLISGKVSRYKDSLQIGITDAYPMDNPDLADFMPGASRSSSEMIDELKQFISSMQEPWKGFMTHLLLDEKFLSKYAVAPAAKSMHHASVGGLLEHSLSMANLAEAASANYPYVNRDLLVSGALVHDMGKVWEYTLDGEFGTSEDGHLVGHITRAAIYIETQAQVYKEINE